VIVVAVALGLSGCGDSENDAGQPSKATTPGSTATPQGTPEDRSKGSGY
jgi:hypothetical protein